MPRSSFSKTFFRIFPPPSYLDMPHAGLDISDSAVHCISFKKNRHKNGFEIGVYGVEPLAPGIVEAGYIKDEAALTAAVTRLAKKLGVVRVNASLPEEKVYLFRTDVPSLDPREISQNIESKLEENVPLRAADAIFDFKIVPPSTGPVAITTPANDSAASAIPVPYSASVSVVPTKVVETYLRVLKNAGLSVASFRMQARALGRALISQDSEETLMIVYGIEDAAPRKKAGIYIVHRRTISFTLTVPIDNWQSEDLFKAAQEVTAYWLSRGEDKPVGRIIACAPDTILPAIEKAGSALGLAVTPANVWNNAFTVGKYVPPITAGEASSYAVAVGLALPDSEML